MATVHDQYVGTADETTYGTPVAPDNFYEFLTDGVSGAYERIEAEGLRGPVLRADRFAPNPKGAAGDFEVEVLDLGFEFWLKHMLGVVAVATGVTTATVGNLNGKSFSYLAARYQPGTDTLVPFGYAGGKVTEWELSAEVDGILKLKASCDFASETVPGSGAQALPGGGAAYEDDAQLLTFIGATCSVGGVAFPVSQISLTGNNGLKVNRYAMRGASSTTKREPKEEAMKEFGFTLTGEFESNAHTARVKAAVASDSLATLSLAFDSPQGGTLTVAAPFARFDEGPVNGAREVTSQELTGKLLGDPDDAASPITLVYTPADA